MQFDHYWDNHPIALKLNEIRAALDTGMRELSRVMQRAESLESALADSRAANEAFAAAAKVAEVAEAKRADLEVCLDCAQGELAWSMSDFKRLSDEYDEMAALICEAHHLAISHGVSSNREVHTIGIGKIGELLESLAAKLRAKGGPAGISGAPLGEAVADAHNEIRTDRAPGSDDKKAAAYVAALHASYGRDEGDDPQGICCHCGRPGTGIFGKLTQTEAGLVCDECASNIKSESPQVGGEGVRE